MNNASTIFLLDGKPFPITLASPMTKKISTTPKRLPRVRKHYLLHRIADTKESKAALKRFGESLRELRNARGFSLELLGREVGCSCKQIWNMEHEISWPSMPVYVALGRVFEQPKPPMM